MDFNFLLHWAIHDNRSSTSSNNDDNINTCTNNSFTCPVCNIEFKRLASFKSHPNCHKVNDCLLCPVCYKDFEFYVRVLDNLKWKCRMISCDMLLHVLETAAAKWLQIRAKVDFRVKSVCVCSNGLWISLSIRFFIRKSSIFIVIFVHNWFVYLIVKPCN